MPIDYEGILRLHKDDPQVTAIMVMDSDIDKRRAFAKLRNQGIIQKNKDLFKDGKPFEQIKKNDGTSSTVHCEGCGGAYNMFFYRHKKLCKQAESSFNKP